MASNRAAIGVRCAIAMALCTTPTIGLRGQDSTAGDWPAPRVWYDAVNSQVEAVKTHLESRFGAQWRYPELPEELRGEVRWMFDTQDDLDSRSRALADRVESQRTEERHQIFDSEDLAARFEFQAKAQKAIEDRQLDWLRERADLVGKVSVHNYNPPDSTDAGAVKRYNDDAYDVNLRIASWRERGRDLEANLKDFLETIAHLNREAADLAERDNVLSRKGQTLQEDLAAFKADCAKAMPRIMGLAQIVDVAGFGGREKQSESPLSLEKIKEKVFDKLKDKVFEKGCILLNKMARKAPLAGLTKIAAAGFPIAVDVADWAEKGVDLNTKDVERNLLLIGNYGRALKRLRSDRSVSPDNPDYQAVRRMLTDLGEDMPTNRTEVVLGSLKSIGRLNEQIAGDVKRYVRAAVGRGTVPVTELVWRELPRSILGIRVGPGFLKRPPAEKAITESLSRVAAQREAATSSRILQKANPAPQSLKPLADFEAPFSAHRTASGFSPGPNP